VTERQGFSAPLRERPFRLLVSGQLISNLGDWLDYLALAVLIAYVWRDGPAALAGLAIAVAIPWVFLAPFSGVLADRWPKRRVMIGCDLGRAAVVTGLVLAPSLAVLLPLVLLKAALGTLFNPAEQATIRFTVPTELLTAANSLSQLVTQSTKVLGPALGGVLVSVASPRAALGVDAATFLASAAILSRLPTIEPETAPAAEDSGDDHPSRGVWRELREGIAYIASRRALQLAIVSLAAAVFLLLAFDTLSPLAFRELGVARAVFGLAVAAVGLGGVLGAILVGRYGGDVNPFLLLGAGKMVVGIGVVTIGVALLTHLGAPPAIWAPLLFIVGLASAGVLIGAPTILQRETPPELMGRVSATASTVPTACQLLAPIVGAAVAAWQSVGFVFVTAGGALALLGLVVVVVRVPVGVGVDDGPAGASLSTRTGDDTPGVSIARPNGASA
jgi:MFS family permease